MTYNDFLNTLQTLMPVLMPVIVWLAGVAAMKVPAIRTWQLQRVAGIVTHGIEQQANGGWSSEEKYAAAEQGLVLLAGKAGYKVTSDEARMLIEASVMLLNAGRQVASPDVADDVPEQSSDEQDVFAPVPSQGQDGAL
jgi:hypothetical protein